MLHTKFRGNQPTGSEEEDFRRDFTIYEHNRHLCHMTRIMLINFMYLKVDIQNLIKNGQVVSEKSIF